MIDIFERFWKRTVWVFWHKMRLAAFLQWLVYRKLSLSSIYEYVRLASWVCSRA